MCRLYRPLLRLCLQCVCDLARDSSCLFQLAFLNCCVTFPLTERFLNRLAFGTSRCVISVHAHTPIADTHTLAGFIFLSGLFPVRRLCIHLKTAALPATPSICVCRLVCVMRMFTEECVSHVGTTFHQTTVYSVKQNSYLLKRKPEYHADLKNTDLPFLRASFG